MSYTHLVYVNITQEEALNRINECDNISPYSTYPLSCTERSFRILGLFTDATYRQLFTENCSRNLHDISTATSRACGKPVEPILKPINSILNNLPKPTQGFNACAVFLFHESNNEKGHTVIATKDINGITTIEDTSVNKQYSGRPNEISQQINADGYMVTAAVSIYKTDSPLKDTIIITPLGGRRKTKRRRTKRKNNKMKSNKNSRK